MTVKEVIEKYNGQYAEVEIYSYKGKVHRIHTDFLENIDGVYDKTVYLTKEIDEFLLMDEDEYNSTILANGSIYADFTDWYDDKNAKVLVITLNEN